MNRNHELVFVTTHKKLRAAPKTTIHRKLSAKCHGSSLTQRELIIYWKLSSPLRSSMNFIEHLQRIHLILFNVEFTLGWDHWESTSNQITLRSFSILTARFSSIVCLVFQLLSLIRIDGYPKPEWETTNGCISLFEHANNIEDGEWNITRLKSETMLTGNAWLVAVWEVSVLANTDSIEHLLETSGK
jgi:hypothetical protein